MRSAVYVTAVGWRGAHLAVVASIAGSAKPSVDVSSCGSASLTSGTPADSRPCEMLIGRTSSAAMVTQAHKENSVMYN
eukprot:7159916-Pyramimonas_sp.AAC.1